jgi:hypothetical protein
MHLYSGFSGSVTAVAVGIAVWCVCRKFNVHENYKLGPSGDPRDYAPIMTKFLRLSEYMTGIATGSIVLIIGSSALHGQAGRLPWFYASPLILIAVSVIYGLSFMAAQILTYEHVLHGYPHTAAQYTLNEMLGYSSLICFVVGYLWLIIATTNMT